MPCGASRETVRRSELAGWANYGYCAAHPRWSWGLKPYLITTPDGMPAAWCLADPKIEEREVAGELLAHARRVRALRPAAAASAATVPGAGARRGTSVPASVVTT